MERGVTCRFLCEEESQWHDSNVSSKQRKLATAFRIAILVDIETCNIFQRHHPHPTPSLS